MQVIHELSWLWKGIGIIALASAIVLIAAFKLHKEEYKIEIACIIFISDYTDWYYCYDSMRSGSDAHKKRWAVADPFLSLRYLVHCSASMVVMAGGRLLRRGINKRYAL